ncbi:uncharacterized protein LOC129233871 [Uloborus diversus]|uniref:uncharacterized protein LOC129233871 n=1 Tax=Uloborus diversus TaxID=327109 RepID=UPI002409CB01|nr:uncharacterized protein LOC129233871 [Uloborus diversus]
MTENQVEFEFLWLPYPDDIPDVRDHLDLPVEEILKDCGPLLYPPLLYSVYQNTEDDEDIVKNYISYQELNSQTSWLRTVDLFKRSPESLRREFSMNSVLKLEFASDNYDQVCQAFFVSFFKVPLLAGLKIGERSYKYVGSSTSQLKAHGLWFYAKDKAGMTALELKAKLGDINQIHEVAKYMARKGQTFSQAMGNIRVPQEYTNVSFPEEDVKGGIKKYLSLEDNYKRKKYLTELFVFDAAEAETPEPYVFSDGIGRLSPEIAKEVYKALDVEDVQPSAMQIRYAGCKGMLVVDPRMTGKKIVFRESMKKFPSDDDSLEILKFSEKRCAFLNRPFITILEQLGVPKENFVVLQKKMLQHLVQSMYYNEDACELLNRNSLARFNFLNMFNAGVRFIEDPMFKNMIYSLIQSQLVLLKDKANIELPVNEARSMFGVLDETFTLEYGQIFVQYTDWDSNEKKILQGTVVVTKNPCMHPGDVRKFEAIDVENLHHIYDCIVFPAKGPRPHPDEMAGSDLDGDEYHVIWMKDLIFSNENKDAMHFAIKKGEKEDRGRPITASDEMDHLCDYILNDNVGLIGSAHLAYADSEKEGIFSDVCLRLAKNYAIALDFAKSGENVHHRDIVYKYPDFMQKIGEKSQTYLSTKALGVLYRNCRHLQIGLLTENF